MRKKEGHKDSTYTTLDAYQAGFLVLKGFVPSLIEEGSKVVFSFTNSDELNRALDNYHSGETVEAFKFALSIKALKSRIFSLRRNKGNHHEQGKETASP